MLKARLDIEWKPRKAHAGAARPAPTNKVAQPQELSAQPGPATGAKNPRGRPRKLNAAQLEELRGYVLKRPETSFWRLHRLVWNRFHLRYSHASLKRLLKMECGIVWTGASKKLGEGLNLTELDAAVATATDWRMKKRLNALVQLAKGREAETVACSNRVHLETLRRWANRYRAHGTVGLRSALT